MGRYDLRGKYALVTGASTGIGNAIARDLAKEGVNMVLCALPAETQILDGFSASLENTYGIKTWSFPIDLAQHDGPQELYQKAKGCLPHLDILVNCAGIDIHGYYHEIPFDKQDKLLLVNVRAYMVLMHCTIPDMAKRKQGRILNVVSAAAFQPCPFLATYGASKAFLQSLSEAVDAELRGTGVTVSTLNPNNVATPLYYKLPQNMLLTKTNPPVPPEFIAGKAVKTIKSGKRVCLPTFQDRFTAFVLPRIVPRSAVNYIAYKLLKVD